MSEISLTSRSHPHPHTSSPPPDLSSPMYKVPKNRKNENYVFPSHAAGAAKTHGAVGGDGEKEDARVEVCIYVHMCITHSGMHIYTCT